MRASILVLSMIALFGAGCSVISPIPPQAVIAGQPNEPRTVKLSGMCADMGWSYESGPGAYNYTAKGPRGDLIVFTIGKDIISINNTKWRQERDTVELKGRDLLLPESTHNFVVKHFGMHHLVRNGVKASQVDYTLDPITPEAVGKVESREGVKATSTELRGLHICIDPGHGGKDMGGEAFGIQEKTIALDVSLMLRDLCEAAGAKVTMTRTTDVYPELDERVKVANTCGCVLFLSVHANIAPNSNEVNGFEAFYNGNSAAGQRFARNLVAAYDAHSEAPNRGAKKDPRGLRVLEKTKVTAVLFELGFLSNEAEGKRLAKKSVQQAMAKALFDGIVNEYSKKASVSR